MKKKSRWSAAAPLRGRRAQLGLHPVVDAVGVGHDQAGRGLAKNLSQSHRGHATRGDHVAQDHARPD